MYLFPHNLAKMLKQYDASKQQFVGPSNLWPDDTLHRTNEFPKGSQTTGLHHPCNGVYCMSAPLVDELYPMHMAGGKFSRSCGKTPDDITIVDLVYREFGVKMQVNNQFHHQHSRNYKLPFYNTKLLRDGAITLYGFDDLPRLHALLYPSSSEPAAPWWRYISDFRVVPPRGIHQNLGLNYCRRVQAQAPSPRVGVGGDGAAAYNWCGPPVQAAAVTEPLCESRGTFKVMHPTHMHTNATMAECPWHDVHVPQSFGTATRLNATQQQRLRTLHHHKHTGRADWGTWQYSRSATASVWRGLAKRLVEADMPGTCCVANPAVPDDQGGRCWWTAADQTECT